jgi:hypothetical protein
MRMPISHTMPIMIEAVIKLVRGGVVLAPLVSGIRFTSQSGYRQSTHLRAGKGFCNGGLGILAHSLRCCFGVIKCRGQRGYGRACRNPRRDLCLAPLDDGLNNNDLIAAAVH